MNHSTKTIGKGSNQMILGPV